MNTQQRIEAIAQVIHEAMYPECPWPAQVSEGVKDRYRHAAMQVMKMIKIAPPTSEEMYLCDPAKDADHSLGLHAAIIAFVNLRNGEL